MSEYDTYYDRNPILKTFLMWTAAVSENRAEMIESKPFSFNYTYINNTFESIAMGWGWGYIVGRCRDIISFSIMFEFNYAIYGDGDDDNRRLYVRNKNAAVRNLKSFFFFKHCKTLACPIRSYLKQRVVMYGATSTTWFLATTLTPIANTLLKKSNEQQ